MSATTIGATPAATHAPHQRGCRVHARFRADLATVRLRHAVGSHRAATSVPLRREGTHRPLPIQSVGHVWATGVPKPAANFAFFREPLRQNAALLGKWGAAASAGSRSEAWSHFVADVGARFFKGSRRQRVMDALVLSLDILPARHRADALACLLNDGVEGRAAVEEFWKYVGMERIPEIDRPRVAALIRRFGIGG
ncbi:hypothetical protein [Pandoraea anhela]|nr:hypothetical protein [Pandoraea anhela]